MIIDLSHTLAVGVEPYPGDPAVMIDLLSSIEQGDDFTLHLLRTGLHAGTHLDAPSHFFSDAATIDQVELEACVGEAVLVCTDQDVIVDSVLPFEERIRATRRVIFNSSWYRNWGKDNYFTDHPSVNQQAAELLLSWGVKLIGVDFPSVDFAPFATHRTLLSNGVLILENLTNLDAVPDSRFKLIAQPLKIAGVEASPVRALAVV